MKKILRIYVAGIGWIDAFSQVKRKNKQPDETTWITLEDPIFEIKKEGETWYQQGSQEYHGCHVACIDYAITR